MTSQLEESIGFLQQKYHNEQNSSKKDEMYEALLDELQRLRDENKKLKLDIEKLHAKALPSRDEVETMSSMIDLINKLDESTIEKLNKFGSKK